MSARTKPADDASVSSTWESILRVLGSDHPFLQMHTSEELRSIKFDTLRQVISACLLTCGVWRDVLSMMDAKKLQTREEQVQMLSKLSDKMKSVSKTLPSFNVEWAVDGVYAERTNFFLRNFIATAVQAGVVGGPSAQGPTHGTVIDARKGVAASQELKSPSSSRAVEISKSQAPSSPTEKAEKIPLPIDHKITEVTARVAVGMGVVPDQPNPANSENLKNTSSIGDAGAGVTSPNRSEIKKMYLESFERKDEPAGEGGSAAAAVGGEVPVEYESSLDDEDEEEDEF